MLLAGPGSLHTTCAKLMHTLSMVLPCMAPSKSRVLPVQLVVLQNVAQQPLSRRFLGFLALGSLALGPVWSRWAATSHLPWPSGLGEPVCTAMARPHVCVPTGLLTPGVSFLRAGTPCPFGQGAVTYGQDEHHGPVLEPSKHLQLGTASISCQSVSLLGRPGAAGTSPAGACPLLPLGPLFGDFSAICSDASPWGFLDSPRRPGHCLRLETCALDPGSPQGPVLCPVTGRGL